MTPIYQIIAENRDITDTIKGHLVSLHINNAQGIESDTLTLILDDRNHSLALPRTGAGLKLSLGYKEAAKLYPMGDWVVNQIELSSPPSRMVIKARAVNMAANKTTSGIPNTLQTAKTRAWDNISLGNIAAAIAAEHQLKPAINKVYNSGSPPSVGAALAHISQLNESDMHLLTRLANGVGAVFTIVEGRLLLSPIAANTSASGAALSPLMLTPSQIKSYRLSINDRGKYKACLAYYHDPKQAQKKEVRIGGAGAPVIHITELQRDQQAAIAKAKASLAKANRGTLKLSITLEGNGLLYAGQPITMQDFRGGVDGDYHSISINHRLDAGGWLSVVECGL